MPLLALLPRLKFAPAAATETANFLKFIFNIHLPSYLLLIDGKFSKK